MSWQDIVKYGEGYIPQGASDEETRLQMEFQDDDRREQAREFLKEDVENVLRELEEFQGSGMGQMDLAGEMEDLSKALGKVSVLLQNWL